MIDLVLLWHMHQPSYVHPVSGCSVLPWVRLHACSGYLDMARALERRPRVRVTVNFVPSLVAQIEAAVAGKRDALEALAERPVSSLDDAERAAVVAGSFSVYARAIEVRPRFAELSRKPKQGPWSDQELCDLQCLFLLGWLGFAAREDAPEILGIEQKGRDFSEEDKAFVVSIVRSAMAQVLPSWRALAERGQVELCASPFHHPILPLLIDSDVARRSRPDDALPARFAHPDDATEQVVRAIESHTRVFGAPPRGMWPPEGSLSPEAVSVYRACGVAWLGGDEETLARSIAGESSKGSAEDPRERSEASAALGAAVEAPALLTDMRAKGRLAKVFRYDGVDLLFRDRDLSDRIGFRYARASAREAVRDFLHGVHVSGGDDGVVSVFLDGENAWETYAWRGRDFLDTLYGRLEEEAAEGSITARTVSETIARRGPGTALAQLHSGSWIGSDFRTWIGDPVKNRAWNALGRARARLERVVAERGGEDAATRRARDLLLVAESSDWFWWFGEPNHSRDEPLFDELFRAHIAAAYEALGDDAQALLARSTIAT